MFSLRRKLSENLIVFVLVSFAFASILGVGMSMEIEGGQMSGCPFMANQATLCQMSATEHIAQWQQAFLGIPTKTGLFALVVILLAAVIIPFAKPFSQIKHSEAASRLLFYLRDTATKIFNPLLLAFSDGILNPKIYGPARI